MICDKPGFAICAALKLIEGAPGQKQRLLHQIFRRLVISGEAQGGAQQSLGVRHRHPLKLLFTRATVIHCVNPPYLPYLLRQ